MSTLSYHMQHVDSLLSPLFAIQQDTKDKENKAVKLVKRWLVCDVSGSLKMDGREIKETLIMLLMNFHHGIPDVKSAQI